MMLYSISNRGFVQSVKRQTLVHAGGILITTTSAVLRIPVPVVDVSEDFSVVGVIVG